MGGPVFLTPVPINNPRTHLPFTLLVQGLLNFLWYGLNDSLKQAWLQVRCLTASYGPVVLSKVVL